MASAYKTNNWSGTECVLSVSELSHYDFLGGRDYLPVSMMPFVLRDPTRHMKLGKSKGMNAAIVLTRL